MNVPAHQIFVKRFLDWERVQNRLDHYKHIKKIFPIEKMKQCGEKAPYYCHYISWRLGTWNNEELFQFFDQCLEISMGLPGWDDRPQNLGGCEYDNFWGLFWELQSAVFFSHSLGIKTAWNKSGPDLCVSIGQENLYVECTTYRKSFGIEEYIYEILQKIDSEIKVTHKPFMMFPLQKIEDKNNFLDELFTAFLGQDFLSAKLEEVKKISPILLPVPKEAKDYLYVFLEDSDAPEKNDEDESRILSTGDPECFLNTALKEIICNKVNSNNLINLHPNLLMVNFLLGVDWQLATYLRPLPKFNFGDSIDSVFLTACGIDKLPSLENSFLSFCPN